MSPNLHGEEDKYGEGGTSMGRIRMGRRISVVRRIRMERTGMGRIRMGRRISVVRR